MRPPLRPADEGHRLERLRLFEVLDTAPETALDELATLAALICDAPMAMVSLVDENRQWFKSRIGFPFAETPRDTSFCGHAILESTVFVVPDAARDERFADNPLVAGEPHVRFYAGAPLRTRDGHALGTLCVMDRTPRALTDSQREALDALSRQVMGQLELRRHTQELIESEARLLNVFRSCPAALSVSRWSDRTFVDINPAFTHLLGWTRDEVVGRTAQELDFVTAATNADLRSRLTGATDIRDHEIVVRARDGEIRHVLMASELIELRGERHAVTTFVDITARKQIEVAAGRLAAIVESSDDAIIGKDLTGIIVSWNRGAERIFGYSAEDIVGTSIMRLVPPGREHEETHILEQVSHGIGVTHFETRRRTKDGGLIDVSITTSPIRDAAGTIIGASKIARDITQRRQMEERQRASEARYRALFEHAPDGIVIADMHGVYLDANPSVCRMLGYTRDELVGLNAADLVVPAEQAQIGPALAAIAGHAEYHREWQFRRKDGSSFAADVIGARMPDGSILGVVRDTTERSRSEARLRRLVESNAQGVMFWDASGIAIGANDAFLQIVRRSREDLDARRIDTRSLTPPEYEQADAASRAEIAARGVCTPYEKEFTRDDGSRVSVLLGSAAFADGSGEGVSFVLDLTDRKSLERQFFRAQRMESIGTLAGGIAHDLNNVLAPILLSVGFLKEEVLNPSLVGLLETVEQSALRGAALVQQVLSFARGVEGQHIVVNPVHLIPDLIKVMQDTFPRSIDIRFQPAKGVWNVNGDPTQIHQVLLNLCVNARDAMPDGGSITVRVENVVLDETYAGMNIDARAGAYVMISVADTGSGIAPEHRDRIFEPFFTTKEVGKGTGLGLSTTLAIVKSHGGFIHLYSESGNGTKFKVYFPANATAAAATSVAIDQSRLPRGNGELIMLVDDEAAVRTVASTTLERFGYQVILATNGAEGVALYATNRERIALVLTDMAMPVMDGPAMIIALKSIDPTVKIIGSSGLASNDGVAKALGAGVKCFVPKPYTAEVLLRTIAGILHAEPDA